MEIAGNSLNQPVNFYTKNTGNTINMAINDDNRLNLPNIFAPEFGSKEKVTAVTTPAKRRKSKNKRLNTMDTEYLPDETEEPQEKTDNIFTQTKKDSAADRIRKSIENIIITTPLINYFFLKEKQQEIEKTVNKLNDINQNVDDLLNTAVPFGEENTVYSDIAKNLTNAANIIGHARKNI